MSPIRLQKGLAEVTIYHTINRDEWLHFQVRYWEQGKVKRKQFPTLEEAKAYAEEQLDRLANGDGLMIPVPHGEIARYRSLENMLGKKAKLEEIVHQWLAKKTNYFSPISQSTKRVVDEYTKHRPKDRDLLAKFRTYFESVPFPNIIALDLERFIKDQNLVGNQTRLLALHTLNSLFEWAKEHKYLPPTARTATEEALENKEASSILTPEELRALLKNIPKQDVPTIALSAFAGLSMQQISMLRWEDINWTQRTIDLSTLQIKEPLQLSDGILKILQRYRKPKGPLKQDLTPRNLKRVAVRSGIKHWRPRILTRSSRIYTELKQNPDNQKIVGIEPSEAEKWFKVFEETH